MEKKLQTLALVASRFNQAGITWALGASAMLYFNGITDVFNDIDIMVTDDDISKAREIMSEIGEQQPFHPKPQYKTRHFMEFVIDGVDFDIMAGFVIVKDGIDYDCSLKAEQIERIITFHDTTIPLHQLSLWRRYYELMGKMGKVKMIDDYSK